MSVVRWVFLIGALVGSLVVCAVLWLDIVDAVVMTKHQWMSVVLAGASLALVQSVVAIVAELRLTRVQKVKCSPHDTPGCVQR